MSQHRTGSKSARPIADFLPIEEQAEDSSKVDTAGDWALGATSRDMAQNAEVRDVGEPLWPFPWFLNPSRLTCSVASGEALPGPSSGRTRWRPPRVCPRGDAPAPDGAKFPFDSLVWFRYSLASAAPRPWTNTSWDRLVSPDTRLLANDQKAMKRPSPLMLGKPLWSFPW